LPAHHAEKAIENAILGDTDWLPSHKPHYPPGWPWAESIENAPRVPFFSDTGNSLHGKITS